MNQPNVSECLQPEWNQFQSEPELNHGTEPDEANASKPIDNPSESVNGAIEAQPLRRDRSKVYGSIQNSQNR